jgi:4-hydroxybenzoate polyprenyltransferase
MNVKPYIALGRFDRPIGAWLLFFPCLWGVTLPSFGQPNWFYILFFLVGAFIMRAAGCTVNDIADRKFDKMVTRTKMRPLASGDMSLRQAINFLVILMLLGLLILLQFPWPVISLGAASLVLVVLYPFMKRLTYWPQLFLGLTFNWGALMGYLAMTGSLDMAAMYLYLAGICWTIGYDTIYAHQDKVDDLKIGVKSTALLFGSWSRLLISLFYGGTLLFLSLAGLHAERSQAYQAIVATAGFQLFFQVYTVDFNDSKDCLKKFKSNYYFGILIFLACLLG